MIAVLKITGLIILYILAAVFLLTLIVLLPSVKYRLDAEKHGDIRIDARVSWFFRAFGLKFLAEASDIKDIMNGELKLTVFGRNILKHGADKKKKPKPVKKTEKPLPEAPKKESPPVVLTLEPDAHEEEKPYPKYSRIKMPERKTVYVAEKPSVQPEKAASAKKAKPKKPEKPEKEGIGLGYFMKMPADERKKLVSAVIIYIKSILKTAVPKTFKLRGSFGFSDPSLTGVILGGIYAVKGLTGLDIEVSGDFKGENTVGGSLFMEGRIRPAALLFYTLRLALTRPVFKMIKIYLKR